MDVIDRLADFIATHEGCANCKKDGLIHAYLCPAGYPTQGYGIRVKSLDVPPITKEYALYKFKQVLPIYVKHAITLSPNLVNYPDKLIAVSSFIYNLGPTAYAGSTLRKKVNKEDWQAAAKETQKWVNAGGRKLTGLVKRRKAEAQLLLT